MRLGRLADEHIAAARADEHGRSALLILREAPLRQSVIALAAGTRLGEHTTPPPASLQVLRGTARVTTDDAVVDLPEGALYLLPDDRARHSVTALTDTAVLLTSVNL
ncbi:cupin [Streptomyces venezuelae]|uniref:Cupin n=1 Tax=Streptomyces venezuelae TaxID=54571 RepID=A0A5P2DFR0_STRVZ|nr:cupin [Streptomyces venezuelae]